MWLVGVLGSLALIVLILIDSFEATVQPRRVTHRYRYTRFFYRNTWKLWRVLAFRLPAGRLREAFLSWFGPLSMLALFTNWVIGLILAFALLNWSLGTVLQVAEGPATFVTYLYWSGATFFTLGYGDVMPATLLGRGLAVAEAGMGFGFLAVIISYLPVLYQAFSAREVTISLLDARAGSPPSAAQLLLRLARCGKLAVVNPFLAEWERWAAELLSSHMSFPVLSFYRSQHDNQSWLAALTTMLDTCAFIIVTVKDKHAYQAQLTFAIARHAAVDLALVYKTPPQAPDTDRLPGSQFQRLREELREAGLDLLEGTDVDTKLAEVRGMYEPFVQALARYFLFALPPIVPEATAADNWQRSAWMPRAPAIGSLPVASDGDGHFS
jgi:hypothetical protein